jgi:UrcA family protein
MDAPKAAMIRGVTMTANTYELAATGLVLAAALAVCSMPGVAQEAQPTLEEVIVEAPWLIEREVVGRSPTGARIEEISLTRRIDITDLDLTQTVDVSELESRIDSAARDSCDKLAEMFPLSNPDTRTCVDRAVGEAMTQAQDAVAAATGRRDQDVATAPGDETRR